MTGRKPMLGADTLENIEDWMKRRNADVVDAFTFRMGDRARAGFHALVDGAHGENLGDSYGRRMTEEDTRDAYDARHYGTARTIGQFAGTAAQMAALGPIDGILAGGVGIAKATPLIGREVAMLAGAGGAAGVEGQAIADASRHRIGSPGDYIGAGVGGVVGAVASRGGRAGSAGAISGATTSVAQDLANLWMPSSTRAREAAGAGGLLGAGAGLAGRALSNGLSNAEKEQLGENFSRLRTWSRGGTTAVGPKSREYLPGGGYTYPDQRSYRGAVPQDTIESKFGRSARLSNRQIQASQELPDYRIDHTQPRHVGALAAFPATVFGVQALPDENW
jgi:hypothetical protein